MKISFVAVGSEINSIGFRKMVAVAKSLHDNIEVCYVVPYNIISVSNLLLIKKLMKSKYYTIEIINQIAKHFADSDMICISSMTHFAETTKEIINAIRIINSNVFIVWGGIHPIVNSDDAIDYADAVCIGEGEMAFTEFLLLYKNNEDYLNVKNFWFNIKGQIKKNQLRPLQTQKEMETFPFLHYGNDELIYKPKEGFIPMILSDYLSRNALSYFAIWSIGCPNKCTYCSNSKFIDNDNNYKRLRHPTVDYIINEIKYILNIQPHISFVWFEDDSFMSIPLQTLEEFAKKWKKQINIPFGVSGLFPTYVKHEKMEILIWAGMNRVRMGIQSGSNRILKFYKRSTTSDSIYKAASIISEFSKYMIPPSYDIIVDNPIEERQDIIDTLIMLYKLNRPFTLNISSLRVMPNTELSHEFAKLGIDCKSIDIGIWLVFPSIANIMIYLLAVIRPPEIIFNFLLRFVKPYTVKQRKFPVLLLLVKILFYMRRAFNHLKSLDFSVLLGNIGYILWKFRIIQFYNKRQQNLRPFPSYLKGREL